MKERLRAVTMKIGIMGFRGIPANYGGFETFVEELAPRLVERGHEVTVYGRSNIIDYDRKYYKGIRIRILPTINHKYLDTVAHTFLCVIDSCLRDYDIAFVLNAANSFCAFISRLAGQKVIMNVDGIERLRKKWSRIGKIWYWMGEYLATKFPNEIVADCKLIEKYYLERYGKKSTQIAYGAYTDKVSSTKILEKFGVKKEEYILYVSRLEPDNNAHILIKAFEKVKTDKKLVIVGDAPYSSEYIKSLKATTDPRIIFTGYIYGEGYKEFQSHAYLYVHGNEVGGTNPALLEAMGFGNCVLAVDVPYNMEVVGEAGIPFSKHGDDLTNKLQDLIDNPIKREELQKKAVKRIKKYYSWEDVTDKYERLFRQVTSRV